MEGSVNKTPHTPGTPEVVNATCSAEGLSTTKCTVCGETLSTSVLPKTDHSYGTAWEKNENGHWNTCSVCGEISNVEAHVENNGIVTIPATSSSNGIKTYSCTVCGYELRTEAEEEINKQDKLVQEMLFYGKQIIHSFFCTAISRSQPLKCSAQNM